MELVHSVKQSYQLELHAYQTFFANFKYETPSFLFVEIGTIKQDSSIAICGTTYYHYQTN